MPLVANLLPLRRRLIAGSIGLVFELIGLSRRLVARAFDFTLELSLVFCPAALRWSVAVFTLSEIFSKCAFTSPCVIGLPFIAARGLSALPSNRRSPWAVRHYSARQDLQAKIGSGDILRRRSALASTASSRPDQSYPLLLQCNRFVSNCGSGAHWPVSAHHGVFGLLHIAAHTDPGADLHLAEDDQAGSDHES